MEKQDNPSAVSDVEDLADALAKEMGDEFFEDADTEQESAETAGQADEVCFYHPIKSAAVHCDQCKKPICSDCAEASRIRYGKRTGRYLCFDCSEKLAIQNIMDLNEDKKKVLKHFILFAAGILLGLILGNIIGKNIAVSLIFACLGGILVCAPKDVVMFFSLNFKMAGFRYISWPKKILWVLKALLFGLGQSIVFVIKKSVRYVAFMKDISKKIERNNAAQNRIRDYIQSFGANDGGAASDPEKLRNQRNELCRIISEIEEDSTNVRLS